LPPKSKNFILIKHSPRDGTVKSGESRMSDKQKTKAQLISELAELRQQITELETGEVF